MPLDLDRLEQRIIGVLVEKQTTVPDTYPLTLNALVAGCNQKNNREPQMSVETYEVEGALRSLMDKDWVREMDVAGGRTLRYAHAAADQLGVGEADLAILAELLLRGPQAAGALKTRASRMHPFASPGAVEARLREMAARPVPYVEVLPRRPREHQPRWRHLLGPVGPADEEGPAMDAAPEALPPAAARAPSPTGGAAPPERPSPPPAPAPDEETTERLDALEARLAELEERLDRLEGR